MSESADIAVVGAGAAGLFASIWAGRAAKERGRAVRIVALDGAAKLGAKILVAGGGRCNVTHHAVSERDYHGSTPGAIRTVLRAFTVADTVRFFEERGVTLKREETGKLFPTTDDARTVLDALLGAAGEAGVELVYPWRVAAIERVADGFVIAPSSPVGRASPPAADGTNSSEAGGDARPTEAGVFFHARRVILATGGMALPRSGSDGAGFGFARALGHSVTRTFPALVPLMLAEDCFVRQLSGLTLVTTLTVVSSTGKRLTSVTGSTLCTHFGISGPAVLDISRVYLDALHGDAGTVLRINWTPGMSGEQLDAALLARRDATLLRVLDDPPVNIPERLARALCVEAKVDPLSRGSHLTKEARRALVEATTGYSLPVTGTRGFSAAEATAGGVPLAEVRLDTMESRVCPGLFLCGEVLDVDGRIGGFNFQWAWSSGSLAGKGGAQQ